MKSRSSLLVLALLLSACADAVPGAGLMTVTLVSPNGNEGAAIVKVTGPGINSVSGIGTTAFGEVVGQSITVVVIQEPAGELSFALSVADTTADFTAQVLEVAAPTDAIRGSLAEYEVEIRR